MKPKNRRHLKHFLIYPKAQIQYGSLFLAASILVHVVTTVIVVQFYQIYQSDQVSINRDTFLVTLGLLALNYILIYGFAFLLGLIISHRIYGPLVNFQRQIDRLKSGDLSARIVLRKNDDPRLKLLAESINQVAENLQSKSS